MHFSKLLLSVIFGFALQNGIHGRVIEKRSANPNSDFHAGYTDVRTTNGGTSYTAAIAGQNHETDTQDYYQRIGYVNYGDSMHSLGSTAEIGAGLYRSSGQVKDIFSSGTRRNGDYDIEALAVRGEFGTGAMGRAKLFDATVNTGHVGINMGVNVDTGVIVKDDALEVKFLGIGGSVGRHGIQGCFVICFGFNW